MTTFSDLMHDLGGEYNRLHMGTVVVSEDLSLLLDNNQIKVPESEIIETLTYLKSVLLRVKQYMRSAETLLTLAKPLIEEKAGLSNEIFSLINPNRQISDLSQQTLEILNKTELKISNLQLSNNIHLIISNVKSITKIGKEAEKIFLTSKEKLYESIPKKTDVPYGNEYKILILEDYADVCEYMRNFLVKKRFRVEIALNSQDAIKVAQTFVPQIALLDIKINNEALNGIEALKYLRIYNPNCRCLMVTAIDEKSLLKECMDLGALGRISKPVDLDEMNNALYKIVLEIANGN